MLQRTTPAANAFSAPAPPPPASNRSFAEVIHSRQLFWENIVRDMLTSMSVELGNIRAQLAAAALQEKASLDAAKSATVAQQGGSGNEQEQEDEDGEGVPMFDGRVAIITLNGTRIPVADVQPMLACSLGTTPHERALSADVQCSIFQVRTPAGEVFTIPLNQIATIHVLSPELLEQLQASTGEGPGESRPFGFRAFTSLSRDGMQETP